MTEFRIKLRWRLFVSSALILMMLLLAPVAFGQAAPPTVPLARDGKALLPVVVAPGASAAVRGLADELADYLGRIAGARFEVVSGDGQAGLALGVAADFPGLNLKNLLSGDGFGADEQYLLRTHRRGVYVIGASETAAQHAAWDLLYRLGYRQFFPGEAWEVVPSTRDLKITIDVHERPAYAYRSIWYGSGTWDYNAGPLRQWQVRNRAPGTFQLQSGHAYERIISRYKAEFAEHPEYLGLLDGRRTSSKFCVSNPDLRKLVVRYAIDYFQTNPEANCVSVEPSDGGGWCQCEACAALGSPSNRALMLANEVSAELQQRWPGKYVALYAYSQHSPPPSIAARPRVIVNCATAFLKGGATVEQNIAGWKGQGVRQFGIREYYSVNTWDRDLPGAARGGRLAYLAETIPQFHALGARFLSAEASDNWGPNGLGYYIATRIMWDTGQASLVDALVADFLEKAFGPARTSMATFYQLLGGPEPPLMSHDLIDWMYFFLAEASRKAGNPRVQTRIDQLILYTQYVELFRTYQNAAGDARQAAFEQLLRHAYRMRTTMMVHAKALYRDLPNRDKKVTVPPEARWNVAEGKNPWKSSVPWGRAELQELIAKKQELVARKIAEDLASRRSLGPVDASTTLTSQPEKFSRRLVPCGPLSLPDLPALEDSQTGRRTQVFYTWFAAAPAELRLQVTGGLIASYRDRGNVKTDLFALDGTQEHLVDHQAAVPPDGKPYEVTLRTDRPGLHKLVVADGGDKTKVAWPDGVPRTVELSTELSSADAGRRSGYFYVPRGTRRIRGYASREHGAYLQDGNGRRVFDFANLDGPDYFQVAVPREQDGKLWSFHGVSGRFILLNVPPYSARQPRELLLPKEVVDADKAEH